LWQHFLFTIVCFHPCVQNLDASYVGVASCVLLAMKFFSNLNKGLIMSMDWIEYAKSWKGCDKKVAMVLPNLVEHNLSYLTFNEKQVLISFDSWHRFENCLTLLDLIIIPSFIYVKVHFASSLVVFTSYIGKKQRCFDLKIVELKLFVIKVDCVYSMEIYIKHMCMFYT